MIATSQIKCNMRGLFNQYESMEIVVLDLSNEHWSTEWVPVFYPEAFHFGGKTFLWSTETDKGAQIMALARMYPIATERVELGDVWLNPLLRGKYNTKGVKHACAFLGAVVSKIETEMASEMTTISVQVASNNVPALCTFINLGFSFTNKVKPIIDVTNSVMMVFIPRQRCLPLRQSVFEACARPVLPKNQPVLVSDECYESSTQPTLGEK